MKRDFWKVAKGHKGGRGHHRVRWDAEGPTKECVTDGCTYVAIMGSHCFACYAKKREKPAMKVSSGLLINPDRPERWNVT